MQTHATNRFFRVLLIAAAVFGCLSPNSASASEIEGQAGNGSALQAPDQVTGVLVYGGTPSGVMAAVAAARRGSEVLLIEPSAHVGGMMSNGLSWTDRGDPAVIGGIADEFFDRVQAIEGELRGRFAFQPKTAESVFTAMLAEAGVGVLYGERLAEGASVAKAGSRISSIRLQSGPEIAADVFIDASYEADLMARAGVSYRVGRESQAEFGESLAGVRPSIAVMQVPEGMDPGIPVSAPGELGTGDSRIQSSNYRVCLSTDPGNQVPFSMPAGYDPAQYDLVAEYMAQRLAVGSPPQLHWVMHVDQLVANKWDLNEFGALSLGLPGANYDYPDATEAQRQAIRDQHRAYQAGFLYFLVNDPRVPAELQTEVARFGLCADEFGDNGNWPRELYLREGRRMVGSYVLTQQDIGPVRSKPDVIGLASYRLDSHIVSRWVDGAGVLRAEGGFLTGPTQRWAIPYRSLTPSRAQASNLLVSVAGSATHVAQASLRMEPQYMIMGQAAGTAAAMAATAGIDVQDVSVPSLQNALRAAAAVLDDPGDIGRSTFYDEIVWAFNGGIIEPCGPVGHFCPNTPVTRAMMADFLARGLGLMPSRTDYFTDDEGSPSEANINGVAEAGITLGCTQTTFCPDRSVTRAEMASFLVRAYQLGPTPRDFFTDDEGLRSHHGNINRLAESGITTGCTATTYCPKAWVTRGQMMAFLYRATLTGDPVAANSGGDSLDEPAGAAESPSAAPDPVAESPPAAVVPLPLEPGLLTAGSEYHADRFALPFAFRADEEWTVEFVEDGSEAFTLTGAAGTLLVARPDTVHVDGSLAECLACGAQTEGLETIAAPTTVSEWLEMLETMSGFTIVGSKQLHVAGAVDGIQLDIQSVDPFGSGETAPPIFDAADRSWSLPIGESRVFLFETERGVMWISLDPGGASPLETVDRIDVLVSSIAFD